MKSCPVFFCAARLFLSHKILKELNEKITDLLNS
jgi:hypothetical protein